MKITKTFGSIFLITLLVGYIFFSTSEESNYSPLVAATTTPKVMLTPPIVKENDKKESPIKPIGTFMKVKSDGTHAEGYSIDLWKQEDKIYGLISVHEGLIGNPPAGLLENVQFDAVTRKISFRAKLTLGLFFDKNNSGVPSKNVLEFEGMLNRKKLEGNVLFTNELCANKCPVKKKISLPRSKEWSEGMEEFLTYADWRTDIDKILKFRGPKW